MKPKTDENSPDTGNERSEIEEAQDETSRSESEDAPAAVATPDPDECYQPRVTD
jgi:hypothetical protein